MRNSSLKESYQTLNNSVGKIQIIIYKTIFTMYLSTISLDFRDRGVHTIPPDFAFQAWICIDPRSERQKLRDCGGPTKMPGSMCLRDESDEPFAGFG